MLRSYPQGGAAAMSCAGALLLSLSVNYAAMLNMGAAEWLSVLLPPFTAMQQTLPVLFQTFAIFTRDTKSFSHTPAAA